MPEGLTPPQVESAGGPQITKRAVTRLEGSAEGRPPFEPLPPLEFKKGYDSSEIAENLRQDQDYTYLAAEIQNPDEAERRFRELYPGKAAIYDERLAGLTPSPEQSTETEQKLSQDELVEQLRVELLDVKAEAAKHEGLSNAAELQILEEYRVRLEKELNLSELRKTDPKLHNRYRGLINYHLNRRINVLLHIMEYNQLNLEVNGKELTAATPPNSEDTETRKDEEASKDVSWQDVQDLMAEINNEDPANVRAETEATVSSLLDNTTEPGASMSASESLTATPQASEADDLTLTPPEGALPQEPVSIEEPAPAAGEGPSSGPDALPPTPPVMEQTASTENRAELSPAVRENLKLLLASKEFRSLFPSLGLSQDKAARMDVFIDQFFAWEVANASKESAAGARVSVMHQLFEEGVIHTENMKSEIYRAQLNEFMDRVFGTDSGKHDVIFLDENGKWNHLHEGEPGFKEAMNGVPEFKSKIARFFGGLKALWQGRRLPHQYGTSWEGSVAAGHYNEVAEYQRSVDGKYNLIPTKDSLESVTKEQRVGYWRRKLYPWIVATVAASSAGSMAASVNPASFSTENGGNVQKVENTIKSPDWQDPAAGEPVDGPAMEGDAAQQIANQAAEQIVDGGADVQVQEAPDGSFTLQIFVNSEPINIPNLTADQVRGIHSSGVTRASENRALSEDPDVPLEAKSNRAIFPEKETTEAQEDQLETAATPEQEQAGAETTTWAEAGQGESNPWFLFNKMCKENPAFVVVNNDASALSVDVSQGQFKIVDSYATGAYQPRELASGLVDAGVLPCNQVIDSDKDAWKAINSSLGVSVENFTKETKVAYVPDWVTDLDELKELAKQYPNHYWLPSEKRLQEEQVIIAQSLLRQTETEGLSEGIRTDFNANTEYGGTGSFKTTDDLANSPILSVWLEATALGSKPAVAEQPESAAPVEASTGSVAEASPEEATTEVSSTAEVITEPASDSQSELKEVMAAMGASAPTQETVDQVAAEQTPTTTAAETTPPAQAPTPNEAQAQTEEPKETEQTEEQTEIERLAADPTYGPRIASQMEIMGKYYEGNVSGLVELGLQDSLRVGQENNDQRVAENEVVSPSREDLIAMGNGTEPSDTAAAQAIVDSLTQQHTQEEISSDFDTVMKETGWYAATQSKEFMQRQISYYMENGDFQGLWEADRYWVTQPGEQYKYLGFDSKEAHDAWHSNVLGPAVNDAGTAEAVNEALAQTTLGRNDAERSVEPSEAAPATPEEVADDVILSEITEREGSDVANLVAEIAKYHPEGVRGAAEYAEMFDNMLDSIENKLATGENISPLRRYIQNVADGDDLPAEVGKQLADWLALPDVKADFTSSRSDQADGRFAEGGRTFAAQSEQFADEQGMWLRSNNNWSEFGKMIEAIITYPGEGYKAFGFNSPADLNLWYNTTYKPALEKAQQEEDSAFARMTMQEALNTLPESAAFRE